MLARNKFLPLAPTRAIVKKNRLAAACGTEGKMRLLKRKFLAGAAMLLIAAGCEPPNHGITMSSPPKPLRALTPATGFRLDRDERARIAPGYDIAALERLLAHVTAERRIEILRYFQFPEDRSVSLGLLMKIKDPQLQSLLEEVWAPMWDHVGATDEQLAENTYQYPGRTLAMERRAARKRESTKSR